MTFSASENPALTSIVTEGVDRLAVLANRLVTVSEGVDQLLDEYREQLQVICSNIEQSTYPGLLDLIAMMDQGIGALLERSHDVNESEAEFLREFPVVLMDYLAIPSSKIAASILVRHFRNDEWIRPLEAEEYQNFMDFMLHPYEKSVPRSVDDSPERSDFMLSTDTVEVQDSNVPDSDAAEVDFEQVMSIDRDEQAGIDRLSGENDNDKESRALHELMPTPDVFQDDHEYTVHSGEIEEPDESAYTESGETSHEVIDLEAFMYGAGTSPANEEDRVPVPVAMSDNSAQVQIEDHYHEPVDLDAFMPGPEVVVEEDENQSREEDSHDSDNVESCENDQEVINLQEFNSASDDPGKSADQTADSESTLQFGGEELDESQRELISLVKMELEEVVEASDQLAHLKGQELETHLHDLTEEAENIGNALRLMGLEGLFRSCMVIVFNLQALAENIGEVTDEQWQHVCRWPTRLLETLQDIYDPAGAESLVAYLQNESWTRPLQPDQAEKLCEQLSHPAFVNEDRESRQVTAQPGDMSLDLPDDVNQELLDGLLQDLPTQTETLSRALQDMGDSGNIEDLEVAQRIAHTVKGAANVVGVRGIANLTHHLEDILEIQVKACKKPIAPLMNVLIAAADCLEAMSEALLGLDSPPDNSVEVLQAVLDWANRLDQDGVPENANDVEVEKMATSNGASEQDTSQAASTMPARETSAIENMLRVPAVLADELLRLAGENLISTGQIQEQIRNIIKTQDSIQLHNQSLQQLSFDLEHLIDIQGVARRFNVEESGDFDPLEMDQYNEVHSVSRRLIEIAADAIELTTNLDGQLSNLNNLVIDQSQLQKESQELVLRTRMVSVKTVLQRLKRGVRQACRLTGKQVELAFVDNDTYMDSEVLNELIEPLMHVLRNAVDHGIESVDERKQRGKPETGNIRLAFERMGDQVAIRIDDDGRGLDVDKIRSMAIASGGMPPDAEMSEEAIYRLILENGFSTRDEVTQVSGRGIGLDVVNVKIRELKGSVNIHSEYGNGCRFEMILPISSFSTHSLLIRVREHVYAISNRGVEEILYPGLGELCDIGDEVIFQLEDQAYAALSIDDLLNIEGDRRQDDRNERPILLVREESGARTAIMVQEVIDSRDVVVKPLGPYLPRLDGIIGATVLGDGSVAPVLDMPEILEHRSDYQSTGSGIARRQNVKVSELPYVLVVDDSLSARRSLAQFVEDLGLDVRTARDGMEAVSLIEARQPDLMLVDMEMPRMNGLELTSHVRASMETKKVPVIMITSRSTDKHRAAAIEKGVNHFMVKPFAEEELARYINNALDIAS